MDSKYKKGINNDSEKKFAIVLVCEFLIPLVVAASFVWLIWSLAFVFS